MVPTLRALPGPVLLVLFVVALSGCLGGGDDPAGGATLPYDREALVFEATYYLGDDWSLTEARPLGDAKTAPLGDFYSKWAAGRGFPEWVSKPVGEPIVISGQAELEFWVTTDSVVTSTPGIFPDFVVYFGTSESVMSVVSPTRLQPLVDSELPVLTDLSVIQQGDAVRVGATFDLPPGGITVPATAGVRVITAPVMMETEHNDLEVLYGSEAFPSQVRFNVSYLDEGPASSLEPKSVTSSHRLVAGSFLHGTEEEDVTVLKLPFTVEASTRAVLVDLVYTGLTPFPDMDLYVYDPAGNEFALSVTPGSDESIHLYERNLAAGGPGEWSIKVVNYVTPGATFDLTVTHYG